MQKERVSVTRIGARLRGRKKGIGKEARVEAHVGRHYARDYEGISHRGTPKCNQSEMPERLRHC